jgi:xanthine dehydrogenase YagR molybdenum-binding subunit
MGRPIKRVDGRLKVTGQAKYSAEFAKPEMVRGYLVTSTISKGEITAIDATAAEKSPGVVAVLTHLNAPKFQELPPESREDGIRIEQRMPLSDAKIHYGGQYVALVLADTLEHAWHAAQLLEIRYNVAAPALRKDDAPQSAKRPKENQGEEIQVQKGNVAQALANSELVKIEATYVTPVETHNPMELSATVAVWEDADHLTIYDATQYVKGAQSLVSQVFGLKRDAVRVVCPFVGGAFGCKGPVWPHTFLSAMAARVIGRPVKLELTRQQMFSGTGHRPETEQTIALAATRDGKLQAVRQVVQNATSPAGQWIEMCGIGGASVLYDAPNVEFSHTVYTTNVAQPSFMRAPGECPGTYAMECAIDELAVALKMDPVQFRLANDSMKHPIKQVPWSTRHLKECYELGAAKFGWGRRLSEPRSMTDGHLLVGWGVATATYPAKKWDAEAQIELHADGTAVVRCASHDLGTGAYTAFTQISADAIGLPVEKITFELGSSDLPYGPVAGGSNSTATVGSAIVAAAEELRKQLAALVIKDAGSPLHGMQADDVRLDGKGGLCAARDVSKVDSFAEVLRRGGKASFVAQGKTAESKEKDLAFQSFGAHFCEVKIDPALPLVRVTRVVSVMDCGRVINPKTGGNQIAGGVVMGIGMALEEETVYDPATGLPVTRNLADYHVPVNKDIADIEVHFVGEPDLKFNPMGARGMGEIGITGITAAIANAVFHATGRRIRRLPITLDKLL